MRFFPSNSLAVLSLLSVLTALSACAPPIGSSLGTSTSGSTTEEKATDDLTDDPDNSAVDHKQTVETSTAATTEVKLTEADLSQLEQIVKSHLGKVVVVDVWSTSCAPCMREFPQLVKLSETENEQLVCISLNVDYIGLKSKPAEFYSAKVQEFLGKQRAVRVTNLLSSSADEAVLSKFAIASIPAILIYSADGTLIHSLTDANTGDDGLTYEGDVIPKVKELLTAK